MEWNLFEIDSPHFSPLFPNGNQNGSQNYQMPIAEAWVDVQLNRCILTRDLSNHLPQSLDRFCVLRLFHRSTHCSFLNLNPNSQFVHYRNEWHNIYSKRPLASCNSSIPNALRIHNAHGYIIANDNRVGSFPKHVPLLHKAIHLGLN